MIVYKTINNTSHQGFMRKAMINIIGLTILVTSIFKQMEEKLSFWDVESSKREG